MGGEKGGPGHQNRPPTLGRPGKMPEAKGPLSIYPALKVYFDAGVHNARRGFGARATLGWAIFPGDALRGSHQISAMLTGSELGLAIGYWDLEGKSILERVGNTISSHPASKGPQLYDLVAAYSALHHLRANTYQGRVRMFGDGQQVIDFLNGRDEALRLTVGGEDVARMIREKIRRDGSELSELTWEWVPSEENWFDPILKSLDAELGDR